MRWRPILLAAVLLGAFATPVNGDSAGTSDPALTLTTLINHERAARGLQPLRVDSRLVAIAGERATRLAAAGVLSHAVAGSIPEDLAVHAVRWFGYGEVIGYASGSLGGAGHTILGMWLASPDHWPVLMSARYNYLGVGLASRSSSGVTYSSVVLTESPDRTGAWAAMAGAAVSGDDIRWSWRGADVPLQTHTAGLRDFTLQLRQDRGTWVTIGSGVTATARSTLNRSRGHWYGLRVRARDQAGNSGAWSREFRVWIP